MRFGQRAQLRETFDVNEQFDVKAEIANALRYPAQRIE